MKLCSNHSLSDHIALWNSLLRADDICSLDSAITEPGRQIIEEKFCTETEEVEERLAHACVAFSTDYDHAKRLAGYISNGWFMFATPLLANGGTYRGLPISCYLNYVDDSRQGLADHYTENIWLSTCGGGIGSHWSDVRSVGQSTSAGSETTGVIPFIHVADAQVPAFKQGVTRKGAYAAYLSVSHPEIEEFLSIRSNDGGPQERKSFNTHIGVALPDNFMVAAKYGREWELVDPHTQEVTKTVDARELWGEIIRRRFADRGEPYLFFEDVANDFSQYPAEYPSIKGSNLCTEITLATDKDSTAVCCLSSVNLAKYSEWFHDERFIADLVEMLDNALEVFIRNAPTEMHKAVLSASRERSIGLGAMGLHSYLQASFTSWADSTKIFREIQSRAYLASQILGSERGIPTAAEHLGRRHTHITAIAPNATSSIMLGVSPGIEPFRSNLYTVVQGNVVAEYRNVHLDRELKDHWTYRDGRLDVEGYDGDWKSIEAHNGSVQHLDWMCQVDKDRFLTFSEIDQHVLVQAARLRQVYIDQAQSLNLCFKSTASPSYVNSVHMMAWDEGEGQSLKSLYYCRVDVADKIESTNTQAKREELDILPDSGGNYDSAIQAEFDDASSPSCPLPQPEEEVCLACQG